MDVIETKIDTTSDEYRRNFDSMETLVSELKEELRIARDDRPQKAKDRIASQGKMPIREKLERLLDRNTPFLEIAPLVGRGMYDGMIHGGGLVCGVGVVWGKEVLVTGNDATIKGGATYPMTMKKTLRVQTMAMQNVCRSSP
jgi:3-methylcrotonyl-CoA carboxylase beta subunit